MKLFEFLSSKRDKSWAQYLTPMSIKSHAKAVIEMTELFISSKITLINRVVSLYANETMAGNLHEVSTSQCKTSKYNTESAALVIGI